jgi:TRAP-type C4-dicarboxylate transport system permease small subunit
MPGFLRFYEWLTTALAVVAGVIMSAIFLAVIADVTVRDIGLQPPRHTVPLAEFGLLWITMLGSPWLLRTKGMIIVESLRMVLPRRARRVLELTVYAVCAAVCAVLAAYAASQTIFTWTTNQAEQRAINVPLYYAYFPMFLGFGLMGIEFLRLLFGRDTLYDQSATDQEGF